jgi:predicted RNA-binding Zn ribbon-like protein
LAQQVDHRSAEANEILNRALALRETLYRIFSTSIAGQRPTAEDLTAFNEHFGQAMGFSQIIAVKGGFRWGFNSDSSRLDWIIHPIVRSAAELLVSSELKNVKICAAPDCGWLFLDTSRNRSRRWCEMQDCGNRAKARRFYRKKMRTGTPR